MAKKSAQTNEINTLNEQLNLKNTEIENLIKENENLKKTLNSYTEIIRESSHNAKNDLIKMEKKNINFFIYVLNQMKYIIKNLQEDNIIFNLINTLDNLIANELAKQYGVMRIIVKKDDTFNPEIHRALETVKGEVSNQIKDVMNDAFIKDKEIISYSNVIITTV